MKKILLLSAIIILATGCAGVRNMSDNIKGTYFGYLPCASCPGIHYELSLRPDFTYSETINYAGTQDLYISEHSYKLTRDSVVILQGKEEEEGFTRFAYKNGKLEMLSLSGEKIETGFPEAYILTKDKPDITRKTEPVKKTAFKATGNEPFWSLEIEFDSIIKFTSLTEEYPELIFPFSSPERPGDLSLLTYHGATSDAEIEAKIYREECIDSMKGDLFPYSVTAMIRKSSNDDYLALQGCGKYQGDFRLNDIWILKKIDGDFINMKDSKKYPHLEVDLANKMIFGYAGCNRFHGKGELINNYLVTGNLLSTKMACPDSQDIENKFLKTLSNKTLMFSISDDNMEMTDGETNLTFSRAE